MMNTMKNACLGLCDITTDVLRRIVAPSKIDSLPIYINLIADACYVKYDTVNNRITDITLRTYNQMGITIDVDPIHKKICGAVCGEDAGTLNLDPTVAHNLYSCITFMWKSRLTTDELCTIDADPRFIAADLLA